MKSHRILLFIPAYNCEVQLPRVLDKVDPSIQAVIDEILIIENRSNDATLQVACREIERLPLKSTVIQNDENYSLGGSIKHAFLYAIENGFTHVITLHGDDQADVRDMLDVLTDGSFEECDLVIGARFHPDSVLDGYSRVRIAGNRILNVVFGLVARRKVHDLIAGLNLFKMEFYADREFLKFPNNLTFDAHLLLLSMHRKARIRYIPVTWREEDQVSNAKTVKQAAIILKLLVRYIFTRQRVFDQDKSGRPAGFEYPGLVAAAHESRQGSH